MSRKCSFTLVVLPPGRPGVEEGKRGNIAAGGLRALCAVPVQYIRKGWRAWLRREGRCLERRKGEGWKKGWMDTIGIEK